MPIIGGHHVPALQGSPEGWQATSLLERQRLRRDVRELIIAPRRQHSQKPDEAYDRIERLWPGPYLELFARNRRPGWQAMGNEVDSGLIMQRRWPSNSYPAQASLD